MLRWLGLIKGCLIEVLIPIKFIRLKISIICMRDFVKKIMPRRMLLLGFEFAHIFCNSYYFRKFKLEGFRKDSSDKIIFRQIFITRDYSFRSKIKPKLIIDAGANVGYSALWFANRYKDARIIAIEPESSNFKILKRNTRCIKRIVPTEGGLWSKDTFLKIVDDEVDPCGFQVEEVGPSDNSAIKAVTLNSILKESGCDKIDILKMDIEGSEKEVFSKNLEWMDRTNIIIIELHDWVFPNTSGPFRSAINKDEWNITEKGENLILKRKVFR